MRGRLGVALLGSVVLGVSAAPGQARTDHDGNTPLAEPVAEGDAMPIASGKLVGLAHESSGDVSIVRTKEGSHVLRFENLKTSNGPDLRVYLVEGSDASNDELIKAGKFVDLGALKGNVGNQNYTVPEDVQLERYQSVSIWCRRFSVNFGAAPLSQVQG